MKPEQLNSTIHERARLAIMAALAARGRMSFGELKELLELTDGNLSVHAAVLEEHGLLRVKKLFVDKKPRTLFSITPKGRKELSAYLAQLEKIIQAAR